VHPLRSRRRVPNQGVAPGGFPIFLPLEGLPASLGPGLRTVSGAKRRRGGIAILRVRDRVAT
jgi:hypothetical protein